MANAASEARAINRARTDFEAMFPAWRGSFLLGSMSRIHLNRLRIENDQPVLEERILQGTAGRVRALAVDAAGAVYLGADTGHVLRLTPAEGWR